MLHQANPFGPVSSPSLAWQPQPWTSCGSVGLRRGRASHTSVPKAMCRWQLISKTSSPRGGPGPSAHQYWKAVLCQLEYLCWIVEVELPSRKHNMRGTEVYKCTFAGIICSQYSPKPHWLFNSSFGHECLKKWSSSFTCSGWLMKRVHWAFMKYKASSIKQEWSQRV